MQTIKFYFKKASSKVKIRISDKILSFLFRSNNSTHLTEWLKFLDSQNDLEIRLVNEYFKLISRPRHSHASIFNSLSPKNKSHNIFNLKIELELAIYYWKSNDFEKLLSVLGFHIDNILSLNKDNPENFDSIKLAALTGHVVSYIVSLITENKIPKNSDNVDFFEPVQGVTMSLDDKLFEYYSHSKVTILYSYLCKLAIKLGKIHEASQFRKKGELELRKIGNLKNLSLYLSVTHDILLISSSNFYEIIEIGVLQVYLLLKFKDQRFNLEFEEDYPNVDLNEEYLFKPNGYWLDAEKSWISINFLPLIIKIYNQKVPLDMFVNYMQEYLKIASNKAVWELVFEIFNRICNGKIKLEELKNRYSNFNESNKGESALLCVLGMQFIESSAEAKFLNLLNYLPNLILLCERSSELIDWIVLPHVQEIIKEYITDEFVGEKEKKDILEIELENYLLGDKNFKKAMLTVASHFNLLFKLPENRVEWMNSYS